MPTQEEFRNELIVRSEDGSEKPFELTELQKKLSLEYEKKLNDGRGLANRQVKGRMDEPIVGEKKIAKEFINQKGEMEMIQGVVVDHPEDKVVVNVPVYFSPSGYICGECNYIMAEDGFPKFGKVKAFCTNLHCSQNLITKIISLPFSESCVVSPSEV